MSSIEITTLDIAKFFYNRNIPIKKRSEIIIDLWKNKHTLLEYYMYDNLKLFLSEVNNLLVDISLNSAMFKEIEEIIKVQDDLKLNYSGYGFHKLNKNKTEEFLKECKLRIMYETQKDYISMKMKTLVKSSGYNRKDKRFMYELNEGLSKMRLYITDGYKELNSIYIENSRRLVDVRMDEFIKIYSY